MAANWFDESVAVHYDAEEAAMFESTTLDPVVEVLLRLAGSGPALEFAVGTGRVALALAARGVKVSGIELSEAMINQLRAKPGGDDAAIPVAVGDIATTVAEGAGSFTLVYLVFNTITNLTTQLAQVNCFANAARHLLPGGYFLVETFVPRLQWLPPGQRFVPYDVGEAHIGIDVYDVASQSLISHHVNVRDGEIVRTSIPFRYVWPAELDLMAQLAGMHLVERWSDWDESPFTNSSESHVSLWQFDHV